MNLHQIQMFYRRFTKRKIKITWVFKFLITLISLNGPILFLPFHLVEAYRKQIIVTKVADSFRALITFRVEGLMQKLYPIKISCTLTELTQRYRISGYKVALEDTILV